MGKHHGYKHSRVYNIWCNMKGRCLNQKNNAYTRYGGRGITVCERWLDFRNFVADMGEPPDGWQLERVNNYLGYSPENCIWATVKQQALNRRSNHLLTVDGETKPLSLWAIQYGLSYAVLHQRVYAYGWDHTRAVKTPLQRQGRKGASNGIALTETRRGGFMEGEAA